MTFTSKQNGLLKNDRFLDDAHRPDAVLRTGVLYGGASAQRLDGESG
ncbi:MAG: hypothetical protein KDJ22_02840 [Candidatus Competibacteraceae bacterium]|nr:hypothetical protein [Candidatus Competibacteraceae bacterium]